jgi:hypothetical protein
MFFKVPSTCYSDGTPYVSVIGHHNWILAPAAAQQTFKLLAVAYWVLPSMLGVIRVSAFLPCSFRFIEIWTASAWGWGPVIHAAVQSIRIFDIQESAHFICNEVKYQSFKTLIREALINHKISVMSRYTCSLIAVTFADVYVTRIN